MIQLPPIECEAERLAALEEYEIFDTPPEEGFDDLTRLAAEICETPIAAVSLLDEKRQWFKSRVGLEPTETPRRIAFCAHAIRQRDLFVVGDALADARFHDNPLVTENGVRFYAGAPIVSPQGFALGTLCVIDRVPRTLSARQLDALRALGRQVGTQLELRRTVLVQSRTFELLQQYSVELQRSQERCLSVMNQGREVIFETDRNGWWTYLSPLWTDITGFSIEESLHHNYLHFVYPPDRRASAERFVALLEGVDESGRGEIRYLTKDREIRWFEYVASKARDDNGAVTGVSGRLSDVTERRLAEESIRESEELCRSVLNSMLAHIAVIDRRGRILAVNDAWKRYAVENSPAGADCAEFTGVGVNYLAVCTTAGGEYEDAVIANDGIRRVLEGEIESFSHEYPCHSPTEQRWFMLSAAPLKSRRGAVISHIDITERKRIEKALRESEERYRIVAETASDAILTIDSESRIRFANPAAEQIFGYAQHELVGESLMKLIPERLRAAHDRGARRYAETGEKTIAWRGVEVPAVHKAGYEMTIEISFGEFNENGTHIFTGIVRDVSERKRIAAELQRAKEDAEAATRAKSQFLANMSHEIRTPMNSIIGLTSLLLEDDMPAHQRDLMETVNTSAEALLTIINDILDFSKIEAGKMELETLDFDVRRIVGDVYNLFAREADKKNNRLRFAVSPGVPAQLSGDPGRLRQILTNLVGNAVKFTADGDISIGVEPVGDDDGRPRLAFEVRDTGIGISPEKLAQLFQSFSQADGSIRRRFGGTGLGLAISRQLIELMGGAIEVESEPGRGSVFRFTARFAAAAGAAAASPAGRLPAAARTAPERIGILIADDNAVNRKVASLMLQHLGYRPDVVANGREALEAVRARRYDVVLMDVQMPEMDGLEATRAICRELPRERRPAIVAMTASAMRSDLEECLAAGMDDYLSKPVRKDALAKVLEKFTGNF